MTYAELVVLFECESRHYDDVLYIHLCGPEDDRTSADPAYGIRWRPGEETCAVVDDNGETCNVPLGDDAAGDFRRWLMRVSCPEDAADINQIGRAVLGVA